MADTEIHLWRWRYLDPISGKARVTRHLMTEADARAWDAAATPVADTHETRRVSDDPGAHCASPRQYPNASAGR